MFLGPVGERGKGAIRGVKRSKSSLVSILIGFRMGNPILTFILTSDDPVTFRRDAKEVKFVIFVLFPLGYIRNILGYKCAKFHNDGSTRSRVVVPSNRQTDTVMVP